MTEQTVIILNDSRWSPSELTQLLGPNAEIHQQKGRKQLKRRHKILETPTFDGCIYWYIDPWLFLSGRVNGIW